ncbi:DUF4190 domain-containing protein [Kitasatospora sp. NPDC006697]|uniref:DUF4190 domain-containing protein n=1 Tax=Kitasatospora sp. NPDC006697 TaxID=3364020 RepID=UPI0036BE8669
MADEPEGTGVWTVREPATRPQAFPPFPAYPPPVRPSTNGLAVTSLVTGIICCFWPAAIGFGIASLVQLKKRHQAGRGLAIAGLVLGVLGGLLSAGAAFELVRHAKPMVSAFTLRPGDCFKTTPSLTGAMATKVPCTELHDGEVSGAVRLSGATFPGSGVVEGETAKLCAGSKDAYVMDRWTQSPWLSQHQWAPQTAGDWNRGGHMSICYLVDRDPEAAPHPVRRDASNLTKEQLAFLQAIEPLDRDAASRQDRTRLDATAKDMASAKAALAGVWSGGVQGQIDALVKELGVDAPLWQAAAGDGVTSEDVLYARLAGHDAVAQETAARRALGLAVRPASGEGGG